MMPGRPRDAIAAQPREPRMMRRRHYTGRDLGRAVTIEDLRARARRRLPAMVFEFVDGAAEDEVTLRDNRRVFERLRFVPRTLVDVSRRDQGRDLFGRRVESPLVIAPTGFNGMITRDADLLLARAAKAAGVPFTLSTVSTSSLEEVAREVGGRLWFQLYPLGDAAHVDALVDRAQRAGYEAMMVTTDVPVFGNREWDQRSYLAQGRPTLRARLDVLAHPRWLFDVMIPHGAPRFANLQAFMGPGASAVDGARFMSAHLNPALDWQAIRRLRARWPGTLLVKGILSAEDALIAATEGLDGIVLSNHGGRQLDGAVAPMRVLPEVAAAVGGRLPILVDSGFRRGADVVKAIALGATAVMIGRAVLYGLGAGREAGALRALSILKAEIDRVLGLLGAGSLEDLGPRFLRAGD
jgi:(S)-mandelate dehydrogenase